MAVTINWLSSTPLTDTGIQLTPTVQPEIARQQGRSTIATMTVDATTGGAITSGELGLQSILSLVQDNAIPAAITFTSAAITLPGTDGVYHFIVSGPTVGATENVIV